MEGGEGVTMNAMTDDIRRDLNLFLDILGGTQQEHADEVGINRVSLSRMQTGESGQLPENWVKTLKTYGLRLALIADDDEMMSKARRSVESAALKKRREREG